MVLLQFVLQCCTHILCCSCHIMRNTQNMTQNTWKQMCSCCHHFSSPYRMTAVDWISLRRRLPPVLPPAWWKTLKPENSASRLELWCLQTIGRRRGVGCDVWHVGAVLTFFYVLFKDSGAVAGRFILNLLHSFPPSVFAVSTSSIRWISKIKLRSTKLWNSRQSASQR